MKKIIAINLIIVTLLITLLCPIVMATVEDGESLMTMSNGSEEENLNTIWDEGTTTTNGEDKQTGVEMPKMSTNSLGVVTKIVGRLLLVFPELFNSFLGKIASNGSSGSETFTIEKVITNKYDMFDLRTLIGSKSSTSGTSVLGEVGKNAGIWFISLRNIAIVGCALTLIYIGIRMALETMPLQKARYKQMLVGWFEGFIFLFLLQFIFVAIIETSCFLVDIFAKAIDAKNANYVETYIIKDVWDNINKAGTITEYILYWVLYVMIVYYQIKFFILYLFREIKFAFLIIISPIVCVTYSIDKASDGKAQAFNHLMAEMTIEAFIQPIHLIVYLFFIFSAREILVQNKLLGIVFFSALSNGEKIFKEIIKFGPAKNSTSKSLDDISLGKG